MDEFGLPTSFGRAAKTAKPSINTNTNTNTNTNNSNPTQQRSNGPAGGGRRGGRQGKEQGQGARTSPYPIHSAAGDASADMQVDGFQGHGHGRGRGRGRGATGGGGRGRGRGGNRHTDSDRGTPAHRSSGFSKQQTETGLAFISDSFFEDPWAGLPLKRDMEV